MLYKISYINYKTNEWRTLGNYSALSAIKAVERAITKDLPDYDFGKLHGTRRPTKGRIVFDYHNGMLCAEKYEKPEE